MKCTLCITQKCNLRCSYCYIGKNHSVMPLQIAEQTINAVFDNTPSEEIVDIAFFGGEPLLEFQLIKKSVEIIERHSAYDRERVILSITSNGTVFSDKIGDFLAEHDIRFFISCDGPPHIQDRFRSYPDGKGSSQIVEKTLQRASFLLPDVGVNAVYRPETFTMLPQVVEYFSSMGIYNIHLNPDFSANWTNEDADLLPEVYGRLAGQYTDSYLSNNPIHINLIDNKLSLFLKGGYEPLDRCRMGKGEFAIAPSGNIYPCERLIGSDDGDAHCIGHVSAGLSKVRSCGTIISRSTDSNEECSSCSLADYCMNWCGCSNYFSSGNYAKVSPFICASEKAAILTALNVFKKLESKIGPQLFKRMMCTETLAP